MLKEALPSHYRALDKERVPSDSLTSPFQIVGSILIVGMFQILE
jgi:hypothetical protein